MDLLFDPYDRKGFDTSMTKQYQYPEFDDWFLEIENYGTRAERFYESLENMQSELGKISNGLLWLQAAFECGRMMRDQEE